MDRGYKCITHCRGCSHFDFYKAKCSIGRVNIEMKISGEIRANPNLKPGVKHNCNRRWIDEVRVLVDEASKKWK